MKQPVPTKSPKIVRQGNMHIAKSLVRQNLMQKIINICNLKENSSANLNSLTKQSLYSEHNTAEGPEINYDFQF